MLILAKETVLILRVLFRLKNTPIAFSFHVSVAFHVCSTSEECLYVSLKKRSFCVYPVQKFKTDHWVWFLPNSCPDTCVHIEDKGCCDGRRSGRFWGGEIGRHWKGVDTEHLFGLGKVERSRDLFCVCGGGRGVGRRGSMYLRTLHVSSFLDLCFPDLLFSAISPTNLYRVLFCLLSTIQLFPHHRVWKLENMDGTCHLYKRVWESGWERTLPFPAYSHHALRSWTLFFF